MHLVPRIPTEAARPRMAELATLPVFYTLAGKHVLVAGGSEAAAWKAELLAAAGAIVDVFAPSSDVSDEMEALVDRGLARLHRSHWTAAEWTDLAMAVGDCEDEAEAARFASAARRAGVPVNAIDKPEHCDFQFGSIVNRSPVVVGISTSGAAPILGQAVRQRIETTLPQGLAGWAKIAQRWRDQALRVLQPGAQRRAFWERLAQRAFDADPEEDHIAQWVADAQRATAGRVTLVGAGPGDANYLTIKALRALQAADVILFDDLVSDAVLELARREARRILVGKRSGRDSCKQEDINSTMIALAKAGRHVVRLKSGDPMIFGRAGEEIAALENEGIAVEVVPGISTAFALAAALKVSLTHRDCAQSVRFVTGHSRQGRLPQNLDFGALADPSTTHLYYMAGRTAAELARRLLEARLAPETPVVIASDVSRPEQRVQHSTLASLGTDVASMDLAHPLIIGIGRAFAMSAAGSAALVPLLKSSQVSAG